MDDQQFLADLEKKASEMYADHRARFGHQGLRPWERLPDKVKGVWCARAREDLTGGARP